MRLTTIRTAHGTSAARVIGTTLGLLPFTDVGALLASGPDWRKHAEGLVGDTIDLDSADFAPLIPNPEKIVCVGANYDGHLQEIGISKPDYPTIFAKYSRALIGARDAIQLPDNSDCVDWEAELGVVIGRPLRNASDEEALAAVAGYTIVNDISMRDWQLRTSQFLQGKTFESTTPLGPYLVTPDEVDHARHLRLSCLVGDRVMQDAFTSDMVFSVAEVLTYLSSFITLVPGDVIAMGTPAGVGAFHTPPRYLLDGETVTTRIDGLGEQTNVCHAAAVALPSPE